MAHAGETRRVALITREYQPLLLAGDAPDIPRGGIARAMSMHAHALVAAGLEQVHVITLGPGDEPESFRDGDVLVHRIPDIHIDSAADMSYAFLGKWSHAVADKYAKLDASVGFDVIEAPDWHGEALHLDPRPATALIVSLHSLSAVIGREQERLWTPGERGWDALELLAVERADHVIAPTQRILDASRELLGDRLPPASLIPLPFDGSRFPARERRSGSSPLTLTFVGRIERLKGPDLALRVADAVRARGVPVTLQILGRPNGAFAESVVEPLRAQLDSLEVEWTGELSEKDVAKRLRASDCALLPSRFENFHMAAIEALSSGVPVITTDRSGLTSWFSREHGFLALPVDDDDAYVEAAAEALMDRNWLQSAGAVGAARVRWLLDPLEIAEQVLSVYDDVRRCGIRSTGHAGGSVRRYFPAPAAKESLHEQALEAFAGGRWAEALGLATRGVQADGTIERLNDVAVMLAEAGELEGARALLTACLVIKSGDPDAQRNLAAIGLVPPLIAEEAPRLASRIAELSGFSPVEVTRLLFRPAPPVDVPIKALDGMPIRVRPGTSDVRVLDDTYYGLFHLPPVTRPPALVVDLGSNIGTTLAHYATLFPQARIVGVELDCDNAALCRHNVGPWSDRITLVEGGIAGRDGEVSYRSGLGKEHGYSIHDPGDRRAPAYSLDTVLSATADGRMVDFLKVDIEGAEADVFAAGGDWTRRVRTLKAELHEPYTVEAATRDLEALGFEVERDTHHWSCVVARAA